MYLSVRAPRPSPPDPSTPHDPALLPQWRHAVVSMRTRSGLKLPTAFFTAHGLYSECSCILSAPLTPCSCVPQIGFTEQDLDEVKGLFSDMSLKVLGLTYCISMLHMLFDFLAFKNDVSSGALRERRESCAAECSAGIRC